MTSQPYLHRITEPAAWTPEDLTSDTSYDITLTQRQADKLVDALAAVKKTGAPLARIGKADFPLPASRDVTETIRYQLKEGRGFALLHGFPVEGHALDDVERMYWGFCAHLGIGLIQNSNSTLIHYVTEGKLRPNQGTHGVGNPGKVSLHVDLADCVSLLCVRQPADNPPSSLSSSLTLHNLTAGAASGDPSAPLRRLPLGPPERTRGRRNAHQRLPCAFLQREKRRGLLPVQPQLDHQSRQPQWRLLSRRRSPARPDRRVHPRNLLRVPVQSGRYPVCQQLHHAARPRPARPDRSDEEARLLMRIWFDLENMRDFTDEAIVRYGIIRHERLGWTAPQLADGIDGKLHARRADGAPLVSSGAAG